MDKHAEPVVLAAGTFSRLIKRGHWEYVERINSSGAVGIVAVTDENKLVLVEQFRIPLQKNVIELPAGLAGDTPGTESEALAIAAKRELLEETGYSCQSMDLLTYGASSGGLTNEIIGLFRARGLTRTGAGGGDHLEEIIVHEVPLDQVREWIAAQCKQGKDVDFKVFAGLYFVLAEK